MNLAWKWLASERYIAAHAGYERLSYSNLNLDRLFRQMGATTSLELGNLHERHSGDTILQRNPSICPTNINANKVFKFLFAHQRECSLDSA